MWVFSTAMAVRKEIELNPENTSNGMMIVIGIFLTPLLPSCRKRFPTIAVKMTTKPTIKSATLRFINRIDDLSMKNLLLQNIIMLTVFPNTIRSPNKPKTTISSTSIAGNERDRRVIHFGRNFCGDDYFKR